MKALELFSNFILGIPGALKAFYLYSPLTRPVRAMVLAYGYVLRGEKVSKPIPWSSI